MLVCICIYAGSSGADSRYISGIVTTRYWGSRYSLLGTRYLGRYSVTEAAYSLGWVVVTGLNQRDSITIVIESTPSPVTKTAGHGVWSMLHPATRTRPRTHRMAEEGGDRGNDH